MTKQAQFGTEIKEGTVVVMILAGMEPIIGVYKGHDFGSVTLKRPHTVGIQQDARNGKTSVGMAPFGAPFMPTDRELRSFPLTSVIQLDLCGEPQLESLYIQSVSKVMPVPADGVNRLKQAGLIK